MAVKKSKQSYSVKPKTKGLGAQKKTGLAQRRMKAHVRKPK